jgi:glycosyltransferase involved in cell wall biosynthesis
MQWIPQVKDEGYEIAMCPFYGLEGGVLEINGIKMYPRIGDVWGLDAMIHHGKKWGSDVTITNQDIWVLDQNALKEVTRWIPWVPIDHDPVPKTILDRLRLAYRIVSYSKFGKKQLENEGLYSTYIPLTVETEILKPMDKLECRKALNIPPDIFLFGMISANKDNPPRKSFQEVMDAFMIFLKTHPKSGIYFGTLLQQQGGFPIMDYATFLGIQDKVYHVEPYDQMYSIDRPAMARVINSFDCLAAPSTNEGFGMPIIEAQSCGVPVITNDFTSMPELIIPNKTGFLTEVAYKRYDFIQSYVGVPSTKSIADQMERMFRSNRKEMGKKGREFVIENYDYKKIFKEKWVPFLQSVEDDVYPSV